MSCLQLAAKVPVARLFHESDRGAVRERRVLIHVDATEMSSTSHAAALVEQFRDYVLTKHTHWVFERYAGEAAGIVSVDERVNGVFPSVMALPPLSEDEVGTLLQRRYEQLKDGTQFRPPVEVGDAIRIYKRFNGDLLGFLGHLGAAVMAEFRAGCARPLSHDEIDSFANGTGLRRQVCSKTINRS